MATGVKYFICENTADRYDVPKSVNFFRLQRPLSEINLFFLKKRFEPLGTFRFFFKTLVNEGDGDYVWEEVIDESVTPLPTFKGELIIKALRLEDRLSRAGAASSGSKPTPEVKAGRRSSLSVSTSLSLTAEREREKEKEKEKEKTAKEGFTEREVELFKDLEKKTHFNLKEIQLMFKKFKKEAPTLEIDRDGFALVTMGMGIRERFLQDAIFNKFDTNRSGSIDFTEFCTGMSTMTRGTQKEKLESAFRMYDLDGSGTVSREEFRKIMESFRQLQGGDIKFQGQTFTDISEICNRVFDEIDTDHSGEISLEEWLVAGASEKHCEFFRSFGVI